MNEWQMHLKRIDDAVDQLESIFRSNSDVAEYIVLSPDTSNIKPVDYLPFVGFTVPKIEKHGFISSVDIYYIKQNEDGRWAINELCPLEEESVLKYRKFFEDDVEGLNNHLVSGYLLGTYGGPDSTLDGCCGQLMVFRGGFYRGIGYYNGTLDNGMDFDKCF